MGRLTAQPGGVAHSHIVVRFGAEIDEWRRPHIAASLGAAAYRPARAGDFARVEVPPGRSAAGLVRRFQGHPGVVWAELDPICHAALVHAAPAAISFNDPLFARQWHHRRIRLPEALERNPTDGAPVIVAIIDSGVAFGGGTQFPRRRGLDLGETEFVPGFDFVDGDTEAFDEGVALDDEDPFRSERFGHGTFAATQIAAAAGNGVGGIGVAPRVRIMPLRALDVTGSGFFSDIAEAIRFAVEHGAKVINMSLGGNQGSSPLQEAVRAARAAGVTLVAAAGNERADDDPPEDVAFPARYREVLAAGATGFDDRPASYSNFGPALDVAAPAGDTLEEVSPGILDGVLAASFVHDPRSGETLYSAFWSTGTSWSAPQVAGAAALLVALGVEDPAALEAMLLQTTRDLGAPGFDEETGHGLLDAFEAHQGLGFSF